MNPRALYALLTDSGTAAAETALCEECIQSEHNKAYARDCGESGGDIVALEDFVDCTENDALNCIICGWPAPDVDGLLAKYNVDVNDSIYTWLLGLTPADAEQYVQEMTTTA